MKRAHEKYTVLVLLDPSAAFDTVDHKTMINGLRDTPGMSGSVLQCLCRCLILQPSHVENPKALCRASPVFTLCLLPQ